MAEIARRCVCCGSQELDRSPAVLMPFVANRAFGWEPVEITPDWGLRTIPTGLAYPLCNSLQCGDCGLVFLDMRFDEDEMARLYDGYRGEAYTAQRDRFEPGYRVHNESILARAPDTGWVEDFLAPLLPAAPRVLDWGGDDGTNTPFRGKAASVEVFDIAEQPLPDGVGRAGRTDLAPGRHDLIVLSHVLEHTPWPRRILEEVRTAMAPDTLLYVEVPFEKLVAETPDSRRLAGCKKHWHEHVNFFTEPALRALFEGAGLEAAARAVRTLPSHANFTQALAAVCRLAAPR